MVRKAVVEGERASLPLLSVVRTLRPDTDCNNRSLRGRCKPCARLLLRSTRVRGLLHKVDRSCTYIGVPIWVNKSRFKLDRDEERFHTSFFTVLRVGCYGCGQHQPSWPKTASHHHVCVIVAYCCHAHEGAAQRLKKYQEAGADFLA